MSTNSMIGLQNRDGTVIAVYCHFDGYTSHNGVILQKHYNTRPKIRKLLSYGNMSFLGKYINPIKGAGENEVCVFYKRDRGETKKADVDPTIYKSVTEYIHCSLQYTYLFSMGKWKVYSPYVSFNTDDSPFMDIDEFDKRVKKLDL